MIEVCNASSVFIQSKYKKYDFQSKESDIITRVCNDAYASIQFACIFIKFDLVIQLYYHERHC